MNYPSIYSGYLVPLITKVIGEIEHDRSYVIKHHLSNNCVVCTYRHFFNYLKIDLLDFENETVLYDQIKQFFTFLVEIHEPPK